jgi:hypothetical protein
MSPEPRPTPAPAPEPVTGNGSGTATGGANGASTGAAPNGQAVLVASGAESALAAVERHLRQEAIEARLVATSRPTAPTGATTTLTRPGTAGRGGSVRVAPVPVGDGWDDDEFWAEARPRRRRPTVDVDGLPDDERRAVGRLQARKVRRILRHVSPWSVLKFSLLFYLCVWMIILVAGVILWRVGQEAGAISNIETFYAKATGEITFELDGRSVFRSAASIGIILVLAGTAFTVMLSLLFNLITDLTGGVRLTVVELGDARRPVNTRRAGGRSLLRRVRPGRTGDEAALPTGSQPSSSGSVPAAR